MEETRKDSKKVSQSRNISRRDYIQYGGLASSVALVGCLGSSDDDDVTIQAATPGGSWGELLVEGFFDPWSEETGHDYEIEHIEGDPMEAQLQANRDDPIKDLAHVNEAQAARLGEQGIFEPVENYSQYLDNLDQVTEGFRSEYLVGKILAPIGLSVNRDLVDREVTSWTDMLDPEFEGQVAFPDWQFVGSDWFYIVNDGLEGSETNIDPVVEFLGGLVENDGITYTTTDEGYRQLSTEEVAISAFWSARTDQLRNEEGLNMEFIYPEEGAMMLIFNMSVVAGRSQENMEAAARLLDVTLRAENQAELVEGIGYPPTNIQAIEHVPDDRIEQLQSLDISQEDLDNAGDIDVDWLLVAEHRDEHGEEWRRIMAS